MTPLLPLAYLEMHLKMFETDESGLGKHPRIKLVR